MRHLIISTLITASVVASTARAGQVTTTFENFGLPANSFDNNAGTSGQFVVDGNHFNNTFDSTFGSWSGWAISSTTDTTTPGFTNQYSSITGSGADNSQTYAVAYTFGPTANPFLPAESFINLAPGTTPVSVDVTNTTYAYFTMLNGNQFAHKFGPGDFFQLQVQGWTGPEGTGTKVGEVDFYLANFLGSNSLIVNTWQTLDLSSLRNATSLQFGLLSTDNDPIFGQNTPSYFAIDNLVLATNAVPEPGSAILMALGLVGVGGLACKGRRAPLRIRRDSAVAPAAAVPPGNHRLTRGQPIACHSREYYLSKGRNTESIRTIFPRANRYEASTPSRLHVD